MTVTLFERISQAFLTANPTFDEREPLISAAQTAERFEDLSPEMQAHLGDLERRREGPPDGSDG